MAPPVDKSLSDKTLKLFVIVSEPISEWIKKGEVVDRYYNPGDLFDEVHLILCNNDQPALDSAQRLVGRARLFVKNFPFSKLTRIRTLGLQPELLINWARPIVEYAREVGPNLVRCHGATQNSFAALKIKSSLDIPYVVSLHTNPDVDVRGRNGPLLVRIHNRLISRVEKKTLRRADLVMPVYEPIVPFLRRIGVERFKVHYNVLNGSSLRPKTNYDLGSPVRLICVGRLFDLKNPYEILRAIARISNIRLAVVGDGPLRPFLENSAELLGVAEKVDFLPAVSNDDLCVLLRESDIFVVHTEHWEISKSVLEALLTGLPVIINHRIGAQVPELDPSFVKFVSNDASEYEAAIREMIMHENLRSQLGRNAVKVSHHLWSPEKCESAVVDTYRKVMRTSQFAS